MKISIVVTLLAAAFVGVAHPAGRIVRDVTEREASSSTCCDFYIKRGLEAPSTCCDIYPKRYAHATSAAERGVHPEKRDVDSTSSHEWDDSNGITKSRGVQGQTSAVVEERVQSIDDASEEAKQRAEDAEKHIEADNKRAEVAKEHVEEAKKHAAKVDKKRAEAANNHSAEEAKKRTQTVGGISEDEWLVIKRAEEAKKRAQTVDSVSEDEWLVI